MSKTYIILALVLLIAAFSLVVLPDPDRSDEINPELLLKKINNPSRYLSSDLIAERLINEDPSIMLIDVRQSYEYESYSLPGAFNISLDQFTDPQWKDYLDAEDMDVVLFSNSDVMSDQAWILGTRMEYDNLYVMEGGLNKWFENIMQPTPPEMTDPVETHELYSFRKAASQYFGGGVQLNTSSEAKSESVPLIRRKKKAAAAGGC